MIWGFLVLAYAYSILSSVFREETFYLSATSKTVSYYQINNQSLPLSQGKFDTREDWTSVSTSQFARLLSTSEYYLTQNRDNMSQQKKCDEFKAEVRYFSMSGWISLVNTTFKSSAYSFQCALDLGRNEIFKDLETKYANDPMMYSESEQADNKARFMLVFSGINEGSIIERYNANDTIISESGVFFSFTQTEAVNRDTRVLEKFRILNFKEKKLEIPFYQSNDPNDEGTLYL